MRRTRLVAAFPGTGKSYFANNKQSVLDLDSSIFNKDIFPSGYVDEVSRNHGKYDLIFISTHDSVRKELRERNLAYRLIYPSRDLRTEYIQRYIERGDDIGFIKNINNNWDKYITQMEEEDFPIKSTKLSAGKFISDIENF